MTKKCASVAFIVWACGCSVDEPSSIPRVGHAGSDGAGGSTQAATTTSNGGSSTIDPSIAGGGSLSVGSASGDGTGGGGSSDMGSAGDATGGSGEVDLPDVFVPPPVSPVTCPNAPVGGSDVHLADFESGLAVIGKDGRAGVWFAYSDGSGKQTDNPIPVESSDDGSHALHVTGGGYTNWGSGIGCSFSHDFNNSVQCPYNASAFTGLHVNVKGTGTVRLRVEQVSTTPIEASDRMGSCNGASGQCDDHYEVSILLTSTWTEHTYKWSDLVQPWGSPVAFDPTTLLGLNFEFSAGNDYELWLDDVAFTQ